MPFAFISDVLLIDGMKIGLNAELGTWKDVLEALQGRAMNISDVGLWSLIPTVVLARVAHLVWLGFSGY